MNKLVNSMVEWLSQECDNVKFVKEENGYYYFYTYDSFENETSNVRAYIFSTDENELGGVEFEVNRQGWRNMGGFHFE